MLCGVFGFAGWCAWTLILHRVLGQDWVVFYAAARAYFDSDLPLVLDGERLTRSINEHYVAWYSMPLILHPWLYPPPFLLLLLPFGLASFGISYILFVGLTFSAHIVAVSRFIGRPVLVICMTLLFPQTPFVFFTGQNTFLTSSLLVGGFGLMERRPLLGGALLGITAYKPQLFLLVPIALIASRQWSALAAAASTAVLLILASFALFGTHIWLDWVHVMLLPNATFNTWLVAGRLNGQSVYACARLAGTSVVFANLAQATAALLGGLCVLWSYRKTVPADLRLAVLLAAMLLASPHVSSQDGILLAVASMFLFHRVIDDGPRFGELSVIVLVWMAELGDPPVVFHLGIITPLVIACFIATVIRRAGSLAQTGR